MSNPAIPVPPQPIRVGLIGYGLHMRNAIIPQLRESPRFDVACVHDVSEASLEAAREDGWNVCRQLEELLQTSGLEAVIIASPNDAHARHCLAAADAGLAILCEKPFVLDYGEGIRVCEAVRQSGVVAHVDLGLPFNPSFQRIREIVKAQLGQIQHLWIRTSRGCGNWLNGARHLVVAHPEVSGGWGRHHLCHALSAAMVLIDKPLESVQMRMQNSTPDCPSEELLHVFLTYEDGATVYLNDGVTIGGFQEAGLVASHGDLHLANGEISYVMHGAPIIGGRPGLLHKEKASERIDSSLSHKPMLSVLDRFADAIRTGVDDGFTFEMALEQIRIIDALYKSVDDGHAVRLGGSDSFLRQNFTCVGKSAKQEEVI